MSTMRILVWNNKGGVGKTTIAVHLYFHMILRLVSVRERSRMEPFAQPVPSINNVGWILLDLDRKKDALAWASRHSDPVLRKGRLTAAAEDNDEHGYGGVVTDVNEARDYWALIVDGPPNVEFLDTVEQHLEISEEDMMLVPVNGRLALDGAVTVAQEIQSRQLGPLRVVLVVNMSDPRDDLVQPELDAVRDLRESMGVEVYDTAIPRSDAIREAELRGIPAWDVPGGPQSLGVSALQGLCRWVARGASKDKLGPDLIDNVEMWNRLSIVPNE